MKKSLLDAFDEHFTKELMQARRNEDAYDQATSKFEEKHGFTAFNSYDSFRLKKKRKARR